MSALTKYDADK